MLISSQVCDEGEEGKECLTIIKLVKKGIYRCIDSETLKSAYRAQLGMSSTL